MQNVIKDGENICFHPKNSKDLFSEGKVFKSVHDHTLSENEIERARVELGETEQKKEECLCSLKRKLLNDGLIKYHTKDSYLLRFLRKRKYDVERAYKDVKLLGEMKKKLPETFVIGPNIKSLLDAKILTFLPYTDEEGRIIYWVNIKRWNLQETSVEELSQVCSLIIERSLMNPKIQINGTIGVWNLEGLTWNHAMEITKRNRFYSYLKIGEAACPYRIHKIIMLNCSPIVRFLYQIACRTVISKKIAERVLLLGSDMTESHQYVNPLILPKELGGRLEDEECYLTDHIMNNLSYIQYERSFVEI